MRLIVSLPGFSFLYNHQDIVLFLYSMMILTLRWFFVFITMLPHGDLDQRIRNVCQQIEASPSDMNLRIERGELYIQHEDYDKAKTDFALCLKSGLNDTRILFGLSNSYLHTGPVDSSIYYIDLVLAREPSHVSANELKSMALSSQGNYCESARIFQNIISFADHPTPILFIQSASAWKLCTEERNIENAIRVLKEGITRIPNHRVLQHHLISAYKVSGMYEEALEIHSSIIMTSANKVRPLFNRAKTYLEAGNSVNAIKDLRSALTSLETLPSYKKDVSAMRELKKEIERLLTELEK